ncbi:hypothetical protein BH11PLA1_BH11PLA1_15300 [soil metagenome]
MRLVLSPYHLAARELPAMFAAQLATRTLTFIPAPADISRAGVTRAFRASPSYLRLFERLRPWAPLFEHGLMSADPSPVPDLDAPPDRFVDQAAADLRADPRWRELQPFLHRNDDEVTELERLERSALDMLKGGPDPALSLPVIAGLDRLAARAGALALRSGGGDGRAPAPCNVSAASGPVAAGSLAQQVEKMLGVNLFSFAAPILESASAATITRLRSELNQERAALAAAIDAACGDARRAALDNANPPIRAAALEYTRAFDVVTRDLIGRDDDAHHRIRARTVSVIARQADADCALTASVVALRRARGASASAVARSTPPLRAPSAPTKRPPLFTLVVTAMGKSR